MPTAHDDFANLTILDHPVIQDRLTRIRDESTPPQRFRRLLDEIAGLMTFRVCHDLPVVEVEVETPLESTTGHRLEHPITLVPILRAGIGMTDGIPPPLSRPGWVIWVHRDEETSQPVPYYQKMPPTSRTVRSWWSIPCWPPAAPPPSRRPDKNPVAATSTPSSGGSRGVRHGRATSRCPDPYRRPRSMPRRAQLHPSRSGGRRRPHLRNAVDCPCFCTTARWPNQLPISSMTTPHPRPRRCSLPCLRSGHAALHRRLPGGARSLPDAGNVDLVFADPPFNWANYAWDDSMPRQAYEQFTRNGSMPASTCCRLPAASG